MNSVLGGDPYTSGQLLRQGLLLSWNKLGREVFCSFAIILCKASFSSPSLSKIWKRMKQSTISCWQPGACLLPTPSAEVLTRLILGKLYREETCVQYLALWTAFFVTGKLGSLWKVLLQFAPGLFRNKSSFVFRYAQLPWVLKKNFFLHLNQKCQRIASKKAVSYFLNLRKIFSFLKCSILSLASEISNFVYFISF